jgi:hypothetical protein
VAFRPPALDPTCHATLLWVEVQRMKRSRVLIATGYWLALLLLVLPLLEPIVTLLPPRPEQIRWRLLAFGALSQSLLLPMVGSMVAIGTAVLLGQRKVVRMLGVVSMMAGVLLGAVAMLFTLDLLQYRGAIGPELQDYYQVAGMNYLVAFVLSAVFLMWIGAASWRAARRSTGGRVQVLVNKGPAPAVVDL